MRESGASPIGSAPGGDVIINAACTLMAERGFAGMSMRGLAQRVGLQVGSLYHHFPSKQVLLEEVLEQIHARRLLAWRSRRSRSQDAQVLLHEFITFHVRRQLYAQAEERFLIMEICHLSDSQRECIQQQNDRYVAELEAILGRGQMNRQFRLGSTQALAHGILGLCSCAGALRQAGQISEAQLIEQVKTMAQRLVQQGTSLRP